MNRREFVTQSCIACLGGGLVASTLSSCSSTHYVAGSIESKGISILKSEFTYVKKNKSFTRQFIVVHHDKLEFPIYLFRINDITYSALWMKCTHQGSELNASGDHLYCSSHGSEFDYTGKVSQGPAEKNLRAFQVTTHDDKIFIELT